MEKVKIKLRKTDDNSYEIVIGKDLLRTFPKELKKNFSFNKYAIITDNRVKKLHGKKLLRQMKASGLNTCMISFNAKEQTKNIETFGRLNEKLLEQNLDRKSAVLALGGGVVGDVAGFVASSFMRGIAFFQVPTTLLAMVDSSIGGKVGVNLKRAKNSVGAFCQPKKVFIDIGFLESLPKKELRNGFVEMIKYGIIADKKYFAFLENDLEKIMELEEKTLIKAIRRSCEIKAGVVIRDEKEGNLRQILNYGHTAAHLIEVFSRHKILHGQAVAIGMNIEARISNRLGLLSKKEVQIQKSLLQKLGFNLDYSIKKSSKEILKQLKKDKKVEAGKIMFSLPKSIGKMYSQKHSFKVEVSTDAILKEFTENR